MSIVKVSEESFMGCLLPDSLKTATYQTYLFCEQQPNKKNKQLNINQI
jgi:hypothetical protein